MAKKVILKNNENVEILPITRGELVLDSSGNEAFHSNAFLATTSLPGLMSKDDKEKLDGLFNTEVDNALDFSSENPVQNKVVSTAIKNITDSYLKSADVNGNTLTITDQDDDTIDFFNTTYSFADGTDGSFTVTPSGGNAQTVKVGGILTDDKVKLTPSSDNKDYRVLFSYTDDDNTKTEGSRKSSKLKFNPSSGALTATTLIGQLDGTYVNKLTNYKKASEASDLTTTDSLNTALGKLEYKADTAFTFCNSIMGPDTDDVINKYDEIVDFIDSVKETETDILDTFVTRKTTLTIDGTKTFSKIIKSTVTNSAPFSVASSTVVTNLNSDLLDGFEANTLFQSLSNVNTETNPNSISIKIGDTTKYLKVGYADKVGSNFTLKVNSGTTEGTDKYTYNGFTAKTLNIKPGSNVSFSTSSGELTINSSYVNTTYSLSGTLNATNTAYITTLTSSNGTETTATISKMVGATSSAAGKAGLVPKPGTGDVNSFLKGDGSWGTPVNTWRPVSVNGTSVATSTTGTGTLNLISGTGISVSGTAVNAITITNTGVRSVAIGTGTNADKLAVDTNGTPAYLTIPYAIKAGRLISNSNTNLGGLSYYYAGGIVSSTDKTGAFAGPTSNTIYSSILRLQSHTTSGGLYYRDLIFDVNSDDIWSRRVTNSGAPVVQTLLHSGNSSISGEGGSTWGSSITVKINGISKTLTIPANPNTWRPITNEYDVTTPSDTTSLSQTGAKSLQRNVRSFKRFLGTATTGGYDLNTLTEGMVYNYSSTNYWKNGPSGMSYGRVLNLKDGSGGSIAGLLAWDTNHGNTEDTTRYLWWRVSDDGSFTEAKWHRIAYIDDIPSIKTLTFSAGTFAETTYNGSANVTVNVPSNFNHIKDATSVSVTSGTVKRKVIVTNVKSEGYISRASIGLSNPANQFSPVIIGVGTNDGGTTFTDYYFHPGGSITDSKGNTYAKTSDIPTIPSLSLGTTTGSGNAVTSITVNGHQITLNKGTTFLTSHQSLANYVTLNTALTITATKTFSVQLKFTVAEGTSPFTVTSTTKVINLNADYLDGLSSGSFGIWRGIITTDPEEDDTTYTSTSSFLSQLHSLSKIFNTNFGAFRGSWYYVGNVNYDTGVGTLDMAGTAVLNISGNTSNDVHYKSLFFLDRNGLLYSYVSQEAGVAAWSRYAKSSEIAVVKQNNTTTNADYRVLFSYNANDTTETKESRKSKYLTFNPSTGVLTTTSWTTSTLNLVSNTSGGKDLGMRVTGSSYSLGFIIGSGNTNRGIYDYTNSAWMLYAGTGAVCVPSWANKGSATLPVYFNASGLPVTCNAYPSVGNGTVTIKQGGTSKGSFTMNQSGNTTIELTDNNTTYSFTNNNPTLAWGTKSTIGTVGGVSLTVTMPANPNTNTWRGITDSYSGIDSTISLSLKGANALYNALLNGYASSSGYSGYISGSGISNLNSPTTWSSDGSRLVYDIYSGSASNKPISVDNANGVITLFKGKHGTSGLYVTLIAAPDNGRLYVRYSLGGSWLGWNTVAWTSEIQSNTDTKNTAGSTNSTSTLYLIGATSLAANPQTYSNSLVYMSNGTLYLVKTTDTAATADNKPALVVGGTTSSTHIEMDCNEIIAKTNGTSISTLYLNSGGTADTVRITESTVGSLLLPVYLSGGAITACNIGPWESASSVYCYGVSAGFYLYCRRYKLGSYYLINIYGDVGQSVYSDLDGGAAFYTSSSKSTKAQLPSGYRPSYGVSFAPWTGASGNENNRGFSLNIDSSGYLYYQGHADMPSAMGGTTVHINYVYIA